MNQTWENDQKPNCDCGPGFGLFGLNLLSSCEISRKTIETNFRKWQKT